MMLLCVSAPVFVSAQSSEDVITNLLLLLDGGGVSTVSTQSATTTTTTTSVYVPKTQPTTTAQQTLNQFHLFDVDGNTVKPDPTVEALKNTIAALLAQFASLTATSTPIVVTPATSTATTTEEVVEAKPRFLRDLTVGSRGEDVTELQLLLIERGLLFGEATGYFGVLTKTAVIALQTDHGLPAVGNVGPRTRALLNSFAPAGEPELTNIPPIRPQALPYTSTSSSMPFSTTTAGTSTPLFDPSAPPVSVSISILPTEVTVGGSVAVTWLSQNATSCEASDGWDGPKSTLGAARIEPLEFSLNFVLTCTGRGGIASTSALVVVGGIQ